MTAMQSAYSILVAIDYSEASELALYRAMELTAANPNAELHIVHVVQRADAAADDDAVASKDDLGEANTQAFRQLQSYVALSLGAFEKKRRGAGVAPLRVVSHLRTQGRAAEIAQLASDLETDLVVVGVHGQGGFSRFFLGSVAETVTRLAPCPVLVFRSKGAPPEYPRIEPPCPDCVDARFASQGSEFWCIRHRSSRAQHYVTERVNTAAPNTNLPLLIGT